MYGVVVYIASRTSRVNTFTVNKIALVDHEPEKTHAKTLSTNVDELALNE